MKLALTAAACVTPLRYVEDPLLLIEDGVIATLCRRTEADLPRDTRLMEFPGAVLAPGFIDVHIHGAAGHDVMFADMDGLAVVQRFLATHGVTSYFPTTVTAPIDATLAALERLATAIERAEAHPVREAQALPLGIHLEGPFLSHEKRGVHPPEHLQAPSFQLFGRMWDAARGRIKLMTIAPELPGALELIEEAVRRGVCVSLGHSNADLDTARAGIAAGARHATHTFNAMRPLDHRDPGIVAAVLGDWRVSAEIICDGVHVAPAMVQLLLKAKGADGAILITDATSATGMPEGRHRLGGFEVEVRNGQCLHEGKLAGSVLTLDRAVRHAMEFAHWDLQDAVRLATINPARNVGMSLRRGALIPGAVADAAVLSPAGEVIKTITRGVGI